MVINRVGVLGLGSIGMRHARNAARLGCEVIAYDPSATAASVFEAEFGRAPSTRDVVLAQADAIIVATPNQFHLDDLRAGIVSGKPVLVEKPLGHDADIAAKILAEAGDRAVTVAASHNLRFRPVVLAAKKILDTGALGKIAWARFCCASWLPDWRPGTDYRRGYAADPATGGIIFDAIHELDLAWHLLGAAQVCATVASNSGLLDIKSDDVADIVLEHDGGCQTAIHLDYVTRPRQRNLEITGSQGILTADLRSGALKLTGCDGTVKTEDVHAFDPNDEYLAVMKDFLTAAATCGQPACPALDALATLRLACEARSRAGLPQAASAFASEAVPS